MILIKFVNKASKAITSKVKETKDLILFPYRYLRARIAYDRAVRSAEDNLEKTGERTYIIKGTGHRLLIINKKNFKKMKKAHLIKSTATIMDLQQNCLFCTPYMNGTGEMPKEIIKLKKAQCLLWLIEGYK